MKMIFLILGLAIGFGGGIWYGINNPKGAADLDAKRQEWMNQGKEQALTAVKDALDKKLASAPTGSGVKPPGFAGFAAGGTGSSKSEADTIKDMKSVVESQLAEVKAKK